MITALILIGFATARADNNDLAKIGEEHLEAGRYREAIKAFEKITETYENIIAINFDLAWCYYLVEDYEKAIPKLVDLAGVRSPNEISRQQAKFLLADSYARMASQQDSGTAERKENIAKATKLHTEFQNSYPTNSNIPNSLYSRAYANYLGDKFNSAETDLQSIIKKYPANPVARDAQYLLANIYSHLGMERMQAGKPEDVKAFMEKARNIFNQLSKGEGNLAMANNSLFSLAQTWFNAGAYRDAMRCFREVRTKQDVVKDLDIRLDVLSQKYAADIGAGGDGAYIKKEIDKLRAQRTSVLEAADVMVSAYLQIAVSYYKQRRYDEARIVCRHLLETAEAAAQNEKEQANYLLVSSYIEEKKPAAAAIELEDFQEIFGTDRPIAEMASIAIGQLFMAQGNVAEAAEQFTKSALEYPNSQAAEEAFYLRFSAEYLLNQPSNSAAAAQAYLDKFPKGRYLPNAFYLKALSLAALGDWDKALSILDDILIKFPRKTDTFQAQDEVAYQKGFVLWQKAESLDPHSVATSLPASEYVTAQAKIIADKKAALNEAIKELKSFTDHYKTSRARPAGLYQLGMALNAAGNLDQARDALYIIHKEYPTNNIAPVALYQIGAIYYASTNFHQMARALDELVQAYPNSPINVDAYFFLGYIANQDGRYDDAVDYLQASLEMAPDNPRAPDCMIQCAEAFSEKAKAMGAPVILSDAKKAVFRDALLQSAGVYEDLLINYPDSDQAQHAIPSIAENIGTLVRYKMIDAAGASAFFNQAMARRPDDSYLRARLMFSMGRYLLKNNQNDQALKAFNDALTTHPDVQLSAEMLIDYADALKTANDLAKAETVYAKIIKDFPDNPRALAPAWFGLADIKFRQNDFAAAKQHYERVLNEYAWYEPGRQGKVKLATIFEKNEEYAQAEQMFTEVWKQEKGEARIGAMLGVARCQLARSEQLRKHGRIQEYKELLKVTDENLTKLIVLYEAFDDYVAEALWLKGQAYELVGDVAGAREAYDRLLKLYGQSAQAKSASERLRELGGPLPSTGAAQK